MIYTTRITLECDYCKQRVSIDNTLEPLVEVYKLGYIFRGIDQCVDAQGMLIRAPGHICPECQLLPDFSEKSPDFNKESK